MVNIRILVVEDESIIAIDIEHLLDRLGYDVAGVASSGVEAIEKAEKIRPDLVLMDIKLEGEADGVKAAEQIRTRFDIPVVYLTAFADEKTLERAKATEPFGYILKPFDEKDLHITIEMALYKHKVDRRLRESEHQLFAILQSIGDAVIATDDGDRVTFLNPQAEAMTGWKQEDALGTNLKDVFKIVNKATDGWNAPSTPQGLQPDTAGGQSQRGVLLGKEGSEIMIELSVTPIKDVEGSVSGRVLVFRDITELRELQDHMGRSERLRALGTMAGAVAHNFNNLLTAVMGHAQLLQMRTADARTMHGLQLIEEAALEGVHMVRRLLDFTEMEVDGPFDLVKCNEVINDAIELTRPRWEQAGHATGHPIEIETHLGSGTTLLGKAGALRQMLVNLIFNAVEALPEGGQVAITTRRQGNQVLLIIQDTGVGMDEVTRQHAFDPFFSTKGRVGVGLGLTESYHIIEQHSGTINLSSTPGEGTTLTMTFPYASDLPEAPQAPTERRQFTPRKLLIIDDEEVVRHVLTALLTDIGHSVLACSDGPTAIATLEHESFDLAFIDLVMPIMGGWELIEIIKRHWPQMPVVVITGWMGPIRPPTSGVSIEGLVRKPFLIEQITRVINNVLEKKP